MTKKFFALGLAGIVASLSLTTGAEASRRMISIDHTKGGKIVNNGINDGRVCKIFMAPKFDKWTETTRMVKTKKCI